MQYLLSVTLDLELVKRAVKGAIDWNVKHPSSESVAYSNICEYGRIPTFRRIDRAQTIDELESVIQDIFAESVNQFLSNEFEALVNGRVAQ